jgi:hypothetical protein
MRTRLTLMVLFASLVGAFIVVAQQKEEQKDKAALDPAAEAVKQGTTKGLRPEQAQTEHDRSDLFKSKNAMPITTVLKGQPKEGKDPSIRYSVFFPPVRGWMV